MLTTTINRLAPRGAPDETAFLPVASVTVADDGAVTLRGDLTALPIGQSLRDPKTREQVTLEEDPERWARLLRFALRSPELQVTTSADVGGALDVAEEPSPIAALRRLTGLSTRAAAAEAGVSQPAWTAAEKRGAGISLDLLDRYAAALGGRVTIQLRTPRTGVLWNAPALEGGVRNRLEAIGTGVTAEQLEHVGAAAAATRAHGQLRSQLTKAAYGVWPKTRGAGWVVQRDGAKRASSTHDTQEAAIAAARPLAERAGVGEVLVHDATGQIRDRVTVTKA